MATDSLPTAQSPELTAIKAKVGESANEGMAYMTAANEGISRLLAQGRASAYSVSAGDGDTMILTEGGKSRTTFNHASLDHISGTIDLTNNAVKFEGQLSSMSGSGREVVNASGSTNLDALLKMRDNSGDKPPTFNGQIQFTDTVTDNQSTTTLKTAGACEIKLQGADAEVSCKGTIVGPNGRKVSFTEQDNAAGAVIKLTELDGRPIGSVQIDSIASTEHTRYDVRVTPEKS
jgi:hypothetical protein